MARIYDCLNNHILVIRDKEDKKKGSLIITRGGEEAIVHEGTVFASSIVKRAVDWLDSDTTIVPGDRILYHVGTEQIIGDHTFEIIKHGDVIAIITEKPDLAPTC